MGRKEKDRERQGETETERQRERENAPRGVTSSEICAGVLQWV